MQLSGINNKERPYQIVEILVRHKANVNYRTKVGHSITCTVSTIEGIRNSINRKEDIEDLLKCS